MLGDAFGCNPSVFLRGRGVSDEPHPLIERLATPSAGVIVSGVVRRHQLGLIALFRHM